MEQQITKLIDGCRQYFIDHSYTKQRIQVYDSLWKNGIIPFMAANGVTLFNSDICRLYVESIKGEALMKSHTHEKVRSVQVLEDYMTLGYIRPRATKPIEHPLAGEIGFQMQKHIQNLTKQRLSEITIKRNRVYMSRFLSYLNLHGAVKMEDIKDEHIAGYLSSPETNNSHVISTLRVLFKFWHNHNITSGNLADSLIPFRPRRREKIPSFYAKEEVTQFESAAERTSGLGKRDYAALLLASRLGLRASDIAGLKFSNIDWDDNEIRLTQYKTGKPISLPLLPEVGNAIIDYLRYGRPKSESQQVFLSHRAPYCDASSKTISAAISRIMVKSGVSLSGRRHGSHSLRHSLASRLLEHETTLSTISETLGHTTSQTTMGYLKIDISSLLKCSLPITQISNDFYSQGGGVFYE